MEFNISNLIVNVNKENIILIITSIFSVVAAIGSLLTSIKMYQQNKFNKRIEHYRQLQEVIKDFYKILPFKWNFKKRRYDLLTDQIKKTDNLTKEFESLSFRVNTLYTEAQFLFKNDVQTFEDDFYNILYKSKKIFDVNEICNYEDDFLDELSIFAERISKRNEIFNKYFKHVSNIFFT
ncbi:hypothetical protein IJ541_07390 [bacterium]|nr:hypothetical protein [bacterium]